MNKIIIYLCCQTFLIFYCMALNSEESSIKTSKDEELNIDVSLCTKEVLLTFFPPPIIKSILIKKGVSEEEATQIAKELSREDPKVVKIVEEKAAKIDPNPLNDLNQRDTAVQIFSETLYEVFSKVLKSHNVQSDDNQIQAILDDMKEVKGKLFVECIKREHSFTLPTP